MGKSFDYVKRTEDFLESISKELEFEVVDVEFVKEVGTYYLRAYCETQAGIGVDECVKISRALSAWLDKEDFIIESYILEVSSPGLGRQLKKDKDFLRETGKEIEVKLYKAIEKQKEFRGVLKSFDKDSIIIETQEGTELKFTRSDIALVKLALDF